MFGSGPYYFGTTRKYVSYFGCLFRNIWIDRTLPDGTIGARFQVPISFAPKEKTLVRLLQDPTGNRGEEITLPAMSFDLVSVTYDPGRHLSPVQRMVARSTSPNTLKYQFVPVPYDFTFNLYVYVKNAEDGTKIIEQILPTFTPEFQARLELIPEMGIEVDIPVVINTVEPFNAYKDESYQEHRAYVWTLSFTLHGWIYGPVREAPIVKFARITAAGGVPGNATPQWTDVTQPGLTANGEPTTNAAASIDPNLIWVDDDFGFVTYRADQPDE